MSKCKFKVGDKVKLIGDKSSVNTKRCEYGEIATIRDVDDKFSYPYSMEEPFNVHIWRDTEFELVERVNKPKIVITTDGVKYVTAKLYDGDTVKVAEAKCAQEDTFDFMVGVKLACERLSPKKEDEWRVVKRPAKVGDYIRIISDDAFSFNYKGQILKVDTIAPNGNPCVYEKNHPHTNPHANALFDWCYAKDWYEVVEKVDKSDEPLRPKFYDGKVVCVEEGYGLSNPVDKFTIGKVYNITNGVITSDTGYKSDHYTELHRVCGGMGWTFIPLVED